VIVWTKVVCALPQGAPRLGQGRHLGAWQRQGEVRHLIAQRVIDLASMLGQHETISQNFC